MIRATLVAVGLLLATTAAHAADACQDLAQLKDLPADFKTVSRSAIGPAKLEIKSNGKCTCNDLPAVQRSLGQAQPEGVKWACDRADADDTKAK